jgi:6-pyruvoyl-tetrahydropterin synthase
VKSRYTATLSFSAGHQLKVKKDEVSPCGDKMHGHHWTVEFTWTREGYPTTDAVAYLLDRAKALDLVLELKNRNLNDMLGAQVPNVFGLASFFMERLMIMSPIAMVEVHEDYPSGPTAYIERDTDY